MLADVFLFFVSHGLLAELEGRHSQAGAWKRNIQMMQAE
jgi:hypothetical protein